MRNLQLTRQRQRCTNLMGVELRHYQPAVESDGTVRAGRAPPPLHEWARTRTRIGTGTGTGTGTGIRRRGERNFQKLAHRASRVGV